MRNSSKTDIGGVCCVVFPLLSSYGFEDLLFSLSHSNYRLEKFGFTDLNNAIKAHAWMQIEFKNSAIHSVMSLETIYNKAVKTDCVVS